MAIFDLFDNAEIREAKKAIRAKIEAERGAGHILYGNSPEKDSVEAWKKSPEANALEPRKFQEEYSRRNAQANRDWQSRTGQYDNDG